MVEDPLLKGSPVYDIAVPVVSFCVVIQYITLSLSLAQSSVLMDEVVYLVGWGLTIGVPGYSFDAIQISSSSALIASLRI